MGAFLSFDKNIYTFYNVSFIINLQLINNEINKWINDINNLLNLLFINH